MKLTKSLLPAAVLTVLGITMAGQAHAGAYAVSTLEIDNLTVVLNPLAGAAVTGFNFNLTNLAALNGTSVSSVGSCSGTITPFANNCGPAGARTDAAVRNLGAPVTGENVFTVHAPGSGEHAYSDSVILSANLTGDATTHTRNIAEAELQSGTSASASAEIQSATGFLFTFTVLAPGDLTLEFDANPYMEVDISNPFVAPAIAQANMKFEAKLSADDSSYFGQWLPQGTATNNCISSNGLCTELADGVDLNNQLTISSLSNQKFDSPDIGFAHFNVNFAGLLAGNYTFSLDEVKSVQLTQSVPEPSSILMLGVGLMTMFFGVRRNRKQSV